mgnify:FL=1
MPAVSITPSYCPFDLTIEYTKLNDGGSAITVCGDDVIGQTISCVVDDGTNDNEVAFLYTKDLVPVGET